MLIKTRDSLEPALAALEVLLSSRSITKDQREGIAGKIAAIRSGAKGEKEAAYHIEFELKDARNWAIIHDLRIEHKGRIAQMDHVLINRHLDVFVIESKNYSTSIRISLEGEFEVKTRYGWKGMHSPVEQNTRHADVLKCLINDEGLFPRRMGIQLQPTFYKWILVAPECGIAGRNPDHSIMKMDMFGSKMEKFRKQDAPLREILKVVSPETVKAICEKLVSYHKPLVVDYAAKFGIKFSLPLSDEDKYRPPIVVRRSLLPLTQEIGLACDSCKCLIETKIVTFCRLNKGRFGGKLLCRRCQTAVTPGPKCDECSSVVDSKVVAYCRFNSRALGKRTLCRKCQSMAVAS